MRNICIVTRSLGAGGAERVIVQLANYLSDLKVNCTIITLEKPNIFYELNQNIDIIEIKKKSKNHYLDKFFKYVEVRNQIKKIHPDIVLAMPEEIGIFVIPSLLGLNIPIVISERNDPKIMPWKKGTRLFRKLFYPFANGFIFQTEQASNFFPDFIKNKGIILPNPLDLNRLPDPFRGIKRKEVVGAGRLEKQKNFPLLIKSFSDFHEIYPDYILTIYGEGSLREELESLASSLLPSESFSFPGKTPNLLENIRETSMFVLSSDYEGMPNVVIEAMALGIPTISTDCPAGGSSEIIIHGENGLLVPVGNKDAMLQAMKMIEEDYRLKSKLELNSVSVREKYDSTLIAEQWREYLESCCSKR